MRAGCALMRLACERFAMNLRSFLFASVAGAALFAAPALATVAPEDAPVSAEAPESGEQILVTARRRQESAQAVPLSISVVGGERIAAQGTYNIAKLTQIQPTLQFYTQNPRNTFINIRGIGAPFGLTNDGFEQGVGIYIDDVYYNRIASATLDFVDVQQIETLRGPQGTLYGKNTTAGAINITTRAPSFDFEAKGELSLGNYNFKQGKGTISGPITDNLAARVSVSATRRDGTIYNTATNQNIQSVDNFGVRSSVLWKPISGLNVTLSGDWNLQSPICCALPYYSYGATQRAANRQLPALLSYFPSYAGPNANPYARTTDVDAQLAARNEHGGLSARVVYDLAPSTTLTSVTAWRYWDWKPANDRDYTGLPVYTKVNNPTKQNQYTQEFRLNHKALTLCWACLPSIRRSAPRAFRKPAARPANICSTPPARFPTIQRCSTGCWRLMTFISTTPALPPLAS
jgi:iron complex outermembrane receptor protein